LDAFKRQQTAGLKLKEISTEVAECLVVLGYGAGSRTAVPRTVPAVNWLTSYRIALARLQ